MYSPVAKIEGVFKLRNMSLDEVKRYIKQLPLELQEHLVFETMKLLPDKSRQKVAEFLGVKADSQLSSQILTAPNIDLCNILEAVIIRHKSDRKADASRHRLQGSKEQHQVVSLSDHRTHAKRNRYRETDAEHGGLI